MEQIENRVFLFSWKVYLKTRYLFPCVLVPFILNSFFTFQHIAVMILGKPFILELLPLPNSIAIISRYVCCFHSDIQIGS